MKPLRFIYLLGNVFKVNRDTGITPLLMSSPFSLLSRPILRSDGFSAIDAYSLSPFGLSHKNVSPEPPAFDDDTDNVTRRERRSAAREDERWLFAGQLYPGMGSVNITSDEAHKKGGGANRLYQSFYSRKRESSSFDDDKGRSTPTPEQSGTTLLSPSDPGLGRDSSSRMTSQFLNVSPSARVVSQQPPFRAFLSPFPGEKAFPEQIAGKLRER